MNADSFLCIFSDPDPNARQQKLDAFLMTASLSPPDDLHLLSTRAEEIRKRKSKISNGVDDSGDSNGLHHSGTHGFFKATTGLKNRLSEGVNRIMGRSYSPFWGISCFTQSLHPVAETSLTSSFNSRTESKPDAIFQYPKSRVFGVALEEHLQSTRRELAVVIEVCVGLILRNPEEEGLFRISGSASRIKKLKSDFDSGRSIDVEDLAFDPHTVAGTLK